VKDTDIGSCLALSGPPSTFSLFHLDVHLVRIDQFSALGGSIPLIDSGAVLGEPRVPVAEQFKRPLDNFSGILVGAGPERLRNQPLVFRL
jgi:hypothetical protein